MSDDPHGALRAWLARITDLLGARDAIKRELSERRRPGRDSLALRRLLDAYDGALGSWRELHTAEIEALADAYVFADPRTERLGAAASLKRMREEHERLIVRGILDLADGLLALAPMTPVTARTEALWPAFYTLGLAARHDGRGERAGRDDDPTQRIVDAINDALPSLRKSTAPGAPESIATAIVAATGIASKIVRGEVEPVSERSVWRMKEKWGERCRAERAASAGPVTSVICVACHRLDRPPSCTRCLQCDECGHAEGCG